MHAPKANRGQVWRHLSARSMSHLPKTQTLINGLYWPLMSSQEVDKYNQFCNYQTKGKSSVSMDLGCPSERSNRKSAPALLATPSHRPWTTGPSPGREIARTRSLQPLRCYRLLLLPLPYYKAATTLFCISQPPLHPLWSLSPPHSPWWGNKENNATKWWSTWWW